MCLQLAAILIIQMNFSIMGFFIIAIMAAQMSSVNDHKQYCSGGCWHQRMLSVMENGLRRLHLILHMQAIVSSVFDGYLPIVGPA